MGSAMRAMGAETYLPTTDEQGEIINLVEALESRGRTVASQPALVTGSGERLGLTPHLSELMVFMLRALADGHAVTVVPRERLLTTQEAAELIGVSRPTLIKILERGELEFELVGRHRRIQLPHLLNYQARVAARRREALDSMVRDAEAGGLYDLLDGPPPRTR